MYCIASLQGYEDRLRHIADNEVNNRPAFVLREGILTEVKSMAIKVSESRNNGH